MFSAQDHQYMQQALRLAEAATRRAAPNPGVGCVLVRDGRVLGVGATLKTGGDHAEIQALKDCIARGESPAGATAYVTLEPCSHHGRTPPCAEALIRHGLARVVAAMSDPYHEVAGRGLALLRAAGILTECGLMESAARHVHRGFLSRVGRGLPWVTLKAASSLDGKTALNNGKSQWITGAEARSDVQRMRAFHDAILTGSGTVRTDNPRLTVRDIPAAPQPLRVVLDSRLETDPASQIYLGGNTLLATCVSDAERQAPYLAGGANVLTVAARAGRADLVALLGELARRGVNHLMVEAGAGLNGALLQAGLVDEIVLYLAPSFIGHDARGLFAWPPLQDLAQQCRLTIDDVRMVGRDLRLCLRPAEAQTVI
jgi:diaminohydroxyphosphoribosylaminopyrimidine deaminase/5-amino-6-(5-phosphoribosylamino)uracil reductase